ncbi:MAG: T9SS type A sorting domain-containing protein, partial [Bacteroidota bacterium]
MIRPVLGGPFRYPATIRETKVLGPTFYPNPWNPNLEPLVFMGPSAADRLFLYDINGRPHELMQASDTEKVAQGLWRTFYRPWTNLVPGLYYVNVTTQDGQRHRSKILVP